MGGLLVALAAGAAMYRGLTGTSSGPVVLTATGTVEGRETNVASKITGRLKAVHVREGDLVHAGQLLAEIESEEFQATLDQATAHLAAARATLQAGQQAVATAAAHLEAAEAEAASAQAGVERAEARLVQAEKDLARDAELYRGGILPRATEEATETERDTRRADLNGARAALRAAQARVEAARRGLDQARADAATLGAGVTEASEGVRLAQVRLLDARITSPIDAVVDYRALEPGEVAPAGAAVLTLVDTADLWVRVDLEQADAARVRPGLPATIRVDGYPDVTLPGQVWDIAREGEFATERDVTRGRQDIRTFRTRVRVVETRGIAKPGMTVRVAIPLGGPSP